ncbi:MAG: acetate kinase [Rickettsiales bacterium]|jgi:acetate kinase|nr:acetate kinase [Rickettsiales bacterium]
MKILAINCGSSSLKYQLYDWNNKSVLSSGMIERIGEQSPAFIFSNHKEKKQEITVACTNHSDAVKIILNHLLNAENNLLKNISELSGTSHRIVHGGEFFSKSTLITPDVLQKIDDLSSLAPLHNPAHVIGIRAIQAVLPNIPHVAVFDTAFHQTMPASSFEYAIPMEWRVDKKIRRYGFHGTSQLYVSRRGAKLLGKKSSDCNFITLHIGNGASVCAIKNGKSFDTSMGFTPLEGAVMGTRCGDMDPAIVTFVQKSYGYSPNEIETVMNKKSGVLGLTGGKYSDRRDIRDNASTDERCKIALDVETYRLRKYIGSYFAALDGNVNAIIFTAGVGEKGGFLRYPVLKNMEKFGILIDEEKTKSNNLPSGEIEISIPESPVKVFVIPTNEEIVSIEDTVGIICGKDVDSSTYDYEFAK